MPVTVQLTDHGVGVVLKTHSPVSGDEIVAAVERFVGEESEALPGIRYWYADHLASGVMDASLDDSWRVAAASIKVARTNPNVAIAVCAPTSRAFVLSEVWRSLAQETGWEIRIFREEDEGKDWLRTRVRQELTFT